MLHTELYTIFLPVTARSKSCTVQVGLSKCLHSLGTVMVQTVEGLGHFCFLSEI